MPSAVLPMMTPTPMRSVPEPEAWQSVGDEASTQKDGYGGWDGDGTGIGSSCPLPCSFPRSGPRVCLNFVQLTVQLTVTPVFQPALPKTPIPAFLWRHRDICYICSLSLTPPLPGLDCKECLLVITPLPFSPSIVLIWRDSMRGSPFHTVLRSLGELETDKATLAGLALIQGCNFGCALLRLSSPTTFF